jgi:N-acetyl-beta-hexosaminidase
VTCVSIKDQPRFQWRGYLLDPARHFRTTEELKGMIDLLAMHKLNVMQLHLTDDQGWRVEIKKHPELTATGARLADCSGKKGDRWFYRQEDIARLQGEFVRRIDRYLTSKGRRVVGWDEIIEGGLQADSRAVVMAWRGAEAVTGATGQQRDVVVTLSPDLYLDNTTRLEQTYAVEPVPSNIQAGREARVLGVQGNMWGEATPTIQRVEEQTFPRLCAIAEIGWTSRLNRNFQDFSSRLVPLCRRLDLLDVRQSAREQPSK